MKWILDMPYRDKVRWKVRLLWLMIVGMLVYMIVVAETGGGDSRIQTRLAESFGGIAFFGSLGVAIWRLVHNKRLLKDRLLMKQDAQKRDERAQYLHDKSGGVVVDALLVCLLFMAMTAAMYNMPAFYMAYAALLLTAALKGLAWLVYSRIG